MGSNNELKKIDTKNYICYYFDDIIKIEDFACDNILIDEKSFENILFYKISYKSLIDVKLLPIRLDKVDGFIRVSNRTICLALYGPEKYIAISNRIRYLIGVTSCIAYVFPNNYARIKVDSYDSLPLEETLTLHNVIILIKSLFNKDQNHYY